MVVARVGVLVWIDYIPQVIIVVVCYLCVMDLAITYWTRIAWMTLFMHVRNEDH
jgi:hypothetical protein